MVNAFKNIYNIFAHVEWVLVVISLTVLSCKTGSKEKLEVVTFGMFKEFVKETGYITDAEKFGWSIVQTDVFNYHKVEGANWKTPDGKNQVKSSGFPVTQVSYNDATAYCEWSGTKLPTYEEYWELIKEDQRRIITGNMAPISDAKNSNVLGNVWEITRTKRENEVRLAGGSLFCSPSTCHGTSRDRELYVDPQTGNLHIGFAILKGY